MGRGRRGGMRNQVLVRLSDQLDRRLELAARQARVTPPELVRDLLDAHLPPAPPPTDPNQLTIGGQTPPESTQAGGAA